MTKNTDDQASGNTEMKNSNFEKLFSSNQTTIETLLNQENKLGDVNEKSQNLKNEFYLNKRTFYFWLMGTAVFCVFLILVLNSFIPDMLRDKRIVEIVDKIENEVGKNPNDPDLRVKLGKAYLLENKNTKAIKQFERALTIDKGYAPAYLQLSEVNFENKDYDNALEYAKIASKLTPNDYQAFVLLGKIYSGMKQYEKAILSLKQAIQFMPSDADILYELGAIHEKKGDFESAELWYNKTLSYNPGHKEALKALNHLKERNK